MKYFEASKKKYLMEKNSNFIAVNIRFLEKIQDKLSPKEALFILKILSNVPYGGHCLRNKNNTIFSYEQMLEKSGVSERTLQRILSDLKEKNILLKRKNKDGKMEYYLNPYFAKRGNRIDKEVEHLFNDNRRQVDK